MTYDVSGLREVPAGKLLPEFANTITAQRGWESELSDALRKLGRGGRRVSQLSTGDIVALSAPQGMFGQGQPALHALQHLLFRFLHSLSIIKSYPAIVEYRSSAGLYFYEALDRMMSEFVTFPTIDEFGGFEQFNVEALTSGFQNVIRRIAARKSRRKNMARLLRQKLQQIAWRIANGDEVITSTNQAEMSFFLAYCNPADPLGLLDRDDTQTLAAPAPGDPAATLLPQDTGDPLVTEEWERYKRCTLAGSFLNYLSMTSNANLEHLIYMIGPTVGPLPFSIGRLTAWGQFDEVELDGVPIVMPWSMESQMESAYERTASYIADPISGMRAPIAVANPAFVAHDSDLRLDVPGVRVRIDLNSKDLLPSDISYHSSWRERVISTSNGQGGSALSLVQDLAYKHERVGGGMTSGKSLTDFEFLDLKASMPYLGQMTPYDITGQMVYDITIPGDAARAVKTVPIDMAPFFKRDGSNMFPPSYREFVSVPLSWYWTEHPDAEGYIYQVLGLNRDQITNARKVIRISFNHAHLRTLLPDARQLPLTDQGVVDYCRAQLGGV